MKRALIGVEGELCEQKNKKLHFQDTKTMYLVCTTRTDGGGVDDYEILDCFPDGSYTKVHHVFSDEDKAVESLKEYREKIREQCCVCKQCEGLEECVNVIQEHTRRIIHVYLVQSVWDLDISKPIYFHGTYKIDRLGRTYEMADQAIIDNIQAHNDDGGVDFGGYSFSLQTMEFDIRDFISEDTRFEITKRCPCGYVSETLNVSNRITCFSPTIPMEQCPQCEQNLGDEWNYEYCPIFVQ